MTSAARRSLAVLALAVAALAAACANLDEGTTPRCNDTDKPDPDTTAADNCFTARIDPTGSAGSNGESGAAGESGSSGEGGSAGAGGGAGDSGEESGAGGSG